jgi:hypothetical protein
MLLKSQLWDEQKTDVFAQVSEIEFNGRCAAAKGVGAPITRHALDHLCSIVTPISKKRLPFKYMADDAPDHVVAEILNAHKQHPHNEKTAILRALWH